MSNKEPKKASIGETFKMKDGSELLVLEYINAKNILVKFTDGNTEPFYCHIGNLRKGKYKNPYKPSLYGFGYIGVGKYSTKTDKKAYRHWSYMITKCYSNKQNGRISEKNHKVCDSWLCFQNFCKWYYTNPYHYYADNEIDKDLINFGNVLYSPENCTLIPREINTKLPKSCSKINITIKKNRYKCWINDFYGNRMSKSGNKSEVLEFYHKILNSKLRLLAEKYKERISEENYTRLINFSSIDLLDKILKAKNENNV